MLDRERRFGCFEVVLGCGSSDLSVGGLCSQERPVARWRRQAFSLYEGHRRVEVSAGVGALGGLGVGVQGGTDGCKDVGDGLGALVIVGERSGL